jgi:hypothetical protein
MHSRRKRRHGSLGACRHGLEVREAKLPRLFAGQTLWVSGLGDALADHAARRLKDDGTVLPLAERGLK